MRIPDATNQIETAPDAEREDSRRVRGCGLFVALAGDGEGYGVGDGPGGDGGGLRRGAFFSRDDKAGGYDELCGLLDGEGAVHDLGGLDDDDEAGHGIGSGGDDDAGHLLMETLVIVLAGDEADELAAGAGVLDVSDALELGAAVEGFDGIDDLLYAGVDGGDEGDAEDEFLQSQKHALAEDVRGDEAEGHEHYERDGEAEAGNGAAAKLVEEGLADVVDEAVGDLQDVEGDDEGDGGDDAGKEFVAKDDENGAPIEGAGFHLLQVA